MNDDEIEYQIPNDPNLSSKDLHPDADLQAADLSDAKLSAMAYMQADPVYADRIDDFEEMRIVGTDITVENLLEMDTPSEEPRAVDLSDADLRDANLSKAWMIGATLTRAYLKDSNLVDANMSNTDLTDTNLENANLSGANLTKANLSGADLRNADLSDAKLRKADLTDAILYGANLSETDLINSDLMGAYLRQADLSGANLEDANLSEANLIESNLVDTSLLFADLQDSNLLKANMTRANLTNTNLDRTLLAETNLDGVSLSRGTSLSGVMDRAKKAAPEETSKEQFHADIARIFHTIKSAYSENGLVARARDARYQERRARRKEAYAVGGWRGYAAWFGSLISNIFTGYGVRLRWVIATMLALYFLSAGVYHYGGNMPIEDSLYYSIVTFTTSPPSPPSTSITRIVAGFETFAGTAAIVFLGYVLGTRERI